jgi:glycosyltransferase involved in cell wall biosynthesis
VTIATSGRQYSDAHSYIDHMRATGLDVRTLEIPRRISPIQDVRRLIELRSLISESRPTLVHTHLSKAGIIGRLAAWRTRVPSVHTVYDYAFVDSSGMYKWAYREVERFAARLSRCLIFISDHERQISEREGIGAPARMVTMGFGVDLERFDPRRVTPRELDQVRRRYGVPSGRRVIGTVARLVPRKQVDKLISAFAHLRHSRLDLHLLVVGGGPLQEGLEKLAVAEGVANSITFTGFIDEEADVPALYASMDVFCLLSRREGYGMAVAEAGAMGKPVVALDISPVNDVVIDGQTGLLTAAADEETVAAALARLLDDPTWAAQVGEAGKRYVNENCDMRDRYARVLDVYRQTLESPGSTT